MKTPVIFVNKIIHAYVAFFLVGKTVKEMKGLGILGLVNKFFKTERFPEYCFLDYNFTTLIF